MLDVHAQIPDTLRYSGDEPVLKVGMVPLCIDERSWTLKVLVHQPHPKRDESETVPFGLCRGTVRALFSDGSLQDVRDMETFDRVQRDPRFDRLETPMQTAMNEAYEELGLSSENIDSIIDMGVLRYESARKGDYGIRFLACTVKAPEHLIPPVDAADVQWKSLPELRRMAEAGNFKAPYLAIARAAVALLAPIIEEAMPGEALAEQA